jgi:hypothetical protein
MSVVVTLCYLGNNDKKKKPISMCLVQMQFFSPGYFPRAVG